MVRFITRSNLAVYDAGPVAWQRGNVLGFSTRADDRDLVWLLWHSSDFSVNHKSYTSLSSVSVFVSFHLKATQKCVPWLTAVFGDVPLALLCKAGQGYPPVKVWWHSGVTGGGLLQPWAGSSGWILALLSSPAQHLSLPLVHRLIGCLGQGLSLYNAWPKKVQYPMWVHATVQINGTGEAPSISSCCEHFSQSVVPAHIHLLP